MFDIKNDFHKLIKTLLAEFLFSPLKIQLNTSYHMIYEPSIHHLKMILSYPPMFLKRHLFLTLEPQSKTEI